MNLNRKQYGLPNFYTQISENINDENSPNILKLPIKFLSDWAFGDLFRGYPFMLFNGNHYIITEIPKSYLFINLLYKSPEYFLISYILFFIIFLKSNFFKLKFKDFNYKILIIFLMIIVYLIY